jgi:hypothetical protein
MNSKDWLGILATVLTLLAGTGAAGIWAADQRYVTQDSIKAIEINRLDREITYIKIKIDQGEATDSEKIYIETLKQQKRAMEQ